MPHWRKWSCFENSSTPEATSYLLVGKQLQGWSQNGSMSGTKIVPLWLVALTLTLTWSPFGKRCHLRGWNRSFFLNMIINGKNGSSLSPFSKTAPGWSHFGSTFFSVLPPMCKGTYESNTLYGNLRAPPWYIYKVFTCHIKLWNKIWKQRAHLNRFLAEMMWISLQIFGAPITYKKLMSLWFFFYLPGYYDHLIRFSEENGKTSRNQGPISQKCLMPLP